MIFAIILFSSCGEKRLNFAMYVNAAPETLDPQIAASPSEITGVLHLFNGLFRKAVNGKAQAECAQSYEVSENGLLYTIKIKDGLVWDSYKLDNNVITPSLTADDFVFALERVFTKSTKSPYTKQFENIANSNEVLSGSSAIDTLGVKAIDEHTLQIRLSKPDPTFLEKLSSPGAMPCNREFFESTNGAYGLGSKTLLVNGDFSLSAWKRDSGLGLIKRGSSKGQVNYLRLVLPTHSDSVNPIERLNDGITDGELVRGYIESKDFDATHFSTTSWCIIFNTKNKVLANIDIRRALAAVAQNADTKPDNQTFLPTLGLIPPSITMLEKSYREYAGNTLPKIDDYSAKFRKGLDELGIDQLSGLTVLLPDDKRIDEMFGEVNQQWQKDLSAFFNINTLPLQELEDTLASGKFDIALAPISQSDNDVSMFLRKFQANNEQNIASYQSAQYDDAIMAADSAEDGIQRATLYKQAEQLLLADAPIIPLFYETSTFLTTPTIKDIIVSPYGPVIDITFATQK